MLVIREIDHVVLRVRDAHSMIRFYCDVLGAKVSRRRPDLGMVHLRAGISMIDLVDVDIEPFDQAAILPHLTANGVKVGEIRSRYGSEGMGISIYLTDPEGNVVELKGPSDGKVD
jgi:glyoxylase I family protein